VVATATGRARIIDLPVFDPKAITEITSYSVFTDTGDFTDELIAQMHKPKGRSIRTRAARTLPRD
jgi:hypothetical protein